MGKQHSSSFGSTLGVAGGNPMASVNATMGKSTSSTTEVTDDEVCLCGILFSKLLNNSQFALH